MNVALLGDVAFTGILCTQPENNQQRFNKILPVLKNCNHVFANLEAPIKVTNEYNEKKNYIHYSTYNASKQLLNLLNITCVSLANNHIYDCKMSGLKATINLLNELGIKHTGAGWKHEHIEPVIIDFNNMKLGFLAYVEKNTNPKTEKFKNLYINYFDPQKVVKDIHRLKKLVGKIICSIHWGEDYSFYPTPVQIETAHSLVDAGVDIIMGHHPHTFQPFENYMDAKIFYSLGSLTFGDYQKPWKKNYQALFRITKRSTVVTFDLKKRDWYFFSVKELQGNYIIPDKRNYLKWSKSKWRLYKLKNSSVIFEYIFNFKEKVLNRVYDYFFGYYQNPIKRLFQFSNIRKIIRLFRSI